MTVSTLNEFSARWGEAIWTASWQGGIALLLAYAVCRAIPRLPPSIRCWLWRLAVLKLLITPVWTGPIELRWLPAPPPSVAAVEYAPLAKASRETDASAPSRAHGLDAAAVDIDSSASAYPSALTCLFTFWILGVVVSGVTWLRDWAGIRRLRLRLTPTTDNRVLGIAGELCQRFEMRRRPLLRVGSDSAGPFLIGSLRPIIVLPSSLTEARCEQELRAALAHELAHVKRRDLLWNWLWMLAAALFFFHPLIWLAKREWSLAQEIATDELALSALQLPAAAYAQSLVEVASRYTAVKCPIFSVAITETYSLLARRIVAMKTPKMSPPLQTIVAVTVVAVAAAGVVPWKLVAQESDLQVRNRAALSYSALDFGEPDVAKALRYGLDDVVGIALNDDKFELTPEQRRTLTELHRGHALQVKKLANRLMGAEPDSPVGEAFGMPEVLGPQFRAELMQHEREFESKLRRELSRRQVELAEAIVLRERAARGGVQAVVASKDLHAVSDLAFERPSAEIESRLHDAARKARELIQLLREELQKLDEQLQQKANEIRQREVQRALDELGEDGRKLRSMVAGFARRDVNRWLAGDAFFDTSRAEAALQYRLASVIVFPLEHHDFNLTLTPQQRVRIEDLHSAYLENSKKRLDASWGIAPGTHVTHIDGSVPPPGQGPEFHAEEQRQEKQFENALCSLLEPSQIELAEDAVLRERFKRGGLWAVIRSTDLPDVARLKLDHARVESRLEDARKNAIAEISEQYAKVTQATEAFLRKASEIRARETELALKDLGNDGNTLQNLMTQIAEGE